MNTYGVPLHTYYRLKTKRVTVGDVEIGGDTRIKVQTMTTTDTMDTEATVAQSIRCIEAGSDLIRITAPSKKEADNLSAIKKSLVEKGYKTPLVADIHYTPNAAEIAARIVEKVRINPGNYIDKKKFEYIEYSDQAYHNELEKIHQRFRSLLSICKEYGTAIRIGTNHGSLSDRIMSRYGDTPMGMVESAMEFLRMARMENMHNIVLSMKSSNTQVMVQAYRMLIQKMLEEFDECYPLHLGITEAGDGEDGRIKSAIGIGTLLEDGIGDTIRVSLTEDPEFEIPVCRKLLRRYTDRKKEYPHIPTVDHHLHYSPFAYQKRQSHPVNNIGGEQVPIVIADMRRVNQINHDALASIGYHYSPHNDKWKIDDIAPEYIYIGKQDTPTAIPTTLGVIVDSSIWDKHQKNTIPLFPYEAYTIAQEKHKNMNLVAVDCFSTDEKMPDFSPILLDKTVVLYLRTSHPYSTQAIRRMCLYLQEKNIHFPIVLSSEQGDEDKERSMLTYATEIGALLIDGWGDGIHLNVEKDSVYHKIVPNVKNVEKFLTEISFGILQGARTRISKTEYISCPSCGRTLFDLQSTTEKVRSATSHLKGLKIAVMGCIVNGPGEMADADFGYVGSGVGKITLYKGKEIVKKNIDSAVAVEELIQLIKESNCWVER